MRPGRFCGLVAFPGGVRRRVLLQLLLLLSHPFPVVSIRPAAAMSRVVPGSGCCFWDLGPVGGAGGRPLPRGLSGLDGGGGSSSCNVTVT